MKVSIRSQVTPFVLAGLVIPALGATALSQTAPQPGVMALAPHRAAYELTLSGTRGQKPVAAARGRIALEFTGTRCDGYAMNFRQVTEIDDGEGQKRMSDLRTTTFEEGEGRRLRFNSQNHVNGRLAQETDGRAERSEDGAVSVRLTKPRPFRADLAGEPMFPTFHMSRLIEAAKRGERFLEAKFYDGSDGGEKVYDSTAIIGAAVPPDGRAVEPEAARAGLAGMRRWPVTLSFFEPGEGERTPIYVLSYDMFENGVSGAIRLNFGDFQLRGELKRLEMLKPAECR
jgi:hypothetical protein